MILFLFMRFRRFHIAKVRGQGALTKFEQAPRCKNLLTGRNYFYSTCQS